MSKLTLRFKCVDCGKVDEDVISCLDGQIDNRVKEYPSADDPDDIRCVACESKYRQANGLPAARYE